GAAALAWLGGWAAFLAAFLPTALGPVRRPVFSGTRG
ncbi:MAG TPA: short-chain dehydrogenase, partial [Paracoccus solventivorans]|nr:short-chain dehydrogenase [Paracoccus solventivorans]